MNILNFLISYFANGFDEKLSPIFKIIADNSFDFKKIISKIDIKTLIPILKEILLQFNNISTNNTNNSSFVLKTEPIKKIADETIVETLNNYFASEI